MEGFARVVLSLVAIVLTICAAVALIWAFMAYGERKPEVSAVYWFMAAVSCLTGAALSAWCVAMLDIGGYVVSLHQMIEKDLHDRGRS